MIARKNVKACTVLPRTQIKKRKIYEKIGKPYPNRTLVIEKLLLWSFTSRASNYVKRCVADQALVREGDSY